jgi:hypothetical protein
MPYDFLKEAWKIGKKASWFRIKKNQALNHKKDFLIIFPDILKKVKGDQEKEIMLFCSMEAFYYGYYYPGLGFEYTKTDNLNDRKFFV